MIQGHISVKWNSSFCWSWRECRNGVREWGIRWSTWWGSYSVANVLCFATFCISRWSNTLSVESWSIETLLLLNCTLGICLWFSSLFVTFSSVWSLLKFIIRSGRIMGMALAAPESCGRIYGIRRPHQGLVAARWYAEVVHRTRTALYYCGLRKPGQV